MTAPAPNTREEGSRYSPLVRNGGVLIIHELFNSDWLDALRFEAHSSRADARRQCKNHSDGGGWRSGNPARRLASADGGPVQTEAYNSPCLWQHLEMFCERAVRPTGGQGTYSYYDEPGDFLGLHRDIRRCDATLITCLVTHGEPGWSGALRVYLKSMKVPLSEIRADTHHVDVRLKPGQSVLLLGGCLPHEILPVRKGFLRHVSVLCFEIAAG